MKKILYLILLLIIVSGCGSIKPKRIIGQYRSTCAFLEAWKFWLFINKDSTFRHRFASFPRDEYVTGRWEIRKDTLILDADIFKKELISTDEFFRLLMENPDRRDLPEVDNYKNTEFEKADAYLIRGKKLYRIMKEGYTKDCHLVKVKPGRRMKRPY